MKASSSTADFRKEITALQPVSAQAAGEFRTAPPNLLSRILRTLETGGSKPGESLNSERLEFFHDAQRFFGITLASVFEFGLGDAPVDEMEWMAGTFRGRGIGPHFLQRMCKTMIIALHGMVGTSALKGTVPPTGTDFGACRRVLLRSIP